MTKRQAVEAWDDMASEQEVMVKTGYSSETLRKMRESGTLVFGRDWWTLQGRKIMYSKKRFVELFQEAPTA